MTNNTPSKEPITLNPLEVASGKITEAKRDTREEGERRRRAWMAHRNSTPVVPANASPHERTALETAHSNAGNRLHSLANNFHPQNFESALLHSDSNRGVLEDALRHVRQLHAEHLKKVKAIAAKVEVADAGRHLFQGEPDFPSAPHTPRPPVVGGLWGQDPELDVPKQIARLSVEIERFPLGESYPEIVGGLNACASAFRKAEPPPPIAKRMDVGWRVPSNM